MRLRFAFLSVIAACAFGACSGMGKGGTATTTATNGGGDSCGVVLPEVVAEVNGEKITKAELEDAASGQLARVKGQIYDTYRVALDGLIGDKLLDKAAKAAGKTPDAYMKDEIESKISAPSDDDLKKFYEQRKAQMGGKKFDEIKGQIAEFLKNQQRQGLQQTFAKKLKEGSTVATHIEAPRTKVDAGTDNYDKGPKNAPIQLIEFTDYQCPFCGRSRPTLQQVLDTYGDKIHYVIRDFPLSFHQFSVKAHEAAYCAGEQGKYWEMNKLLFGNQQALQADKLKEYGKQVGLKMDDFDKCLESGKFNKKVIENGEAGQTAGVSGTPTFFINGLPLSGARPFDDFKKIIDDELAKAK